MMVPGGISLLAPTWPVPRDRDAASALVPCRSAAGLWGVRHPPYLRAFIKSRKLSQPNEAVARVSRQKLLAGGGCHLLLSSPCPASRSDTPSQHPAVGNSSPKETGQTHCWRSHFCKPAGGRVRAQDGWTLGPAPITRCLGAAVWRRGGRLGSRARSISTLLAKICRNGRWAPHPGAGRRRTSSSASVRAETP